MARNRTIYQSDLVYVGPTGNYECTGQHFQSQIADQSYVAHSGSPPSGNLIAELFRVQSANYSWNRTLRDVNQYGELAAIDRISLDQPTVTLDLTYLLSNLVNEHRLGFHISETSQVQAISGILNDETDEKNYFIRTVADGADVVGSAQETSDEGVVAIGNGFITNYTVNGSVGNFPTATVTVEGLNMEFEANTVGMHIPAVIPQSGTQITTWRYSLPTGTQNIDGDVINTSTRNISVLRPGDITFNLGLGAGDGGVSESDLKVQSFTITCPIGRTDLQKLGSKYAFAKVINFPVVSTFSVTADVGDMQTGSLIEIVDNNTSFNPKVTLKNTANTTIAEFEMKDCKLENQAWTSSIGPNKSVTITFSSQLGSAESTTKGLFLSGIYS